MIRKFLHSNGGRWIAFGASMLSFQFYLSDTGMGQALLADDTESPWQLQESVAPDVEQSIEDAITFLARRPYSVPQVPVVRVPNRLGLELAMVRIPDSIKSGTIKRARRFLQQVPLPIIGYDVYSSKSHNNFGFAVVDTNWFTDYDASYQTFRYGRDSVVSADYNWVFGYRFVLTSINGSRDRVEEGVALHDNFSLFSVGGQGTLGYQSVSAPWNVYAGGGMINYKARYTVDPFLVDATFRSNIIYSLFGVSACERTRSACVGIEFHAGASDISFMTTVLNISY